MVLFRFCGLRGATLLRAHLIGTNLRRAQMLNTDLTLATLHKVTLAGADLTDVILHKTVFAECADLHTAHGVDEVQHIGSASLDMSTLRACLPHLSDRFLRGVGFDPGEIALLRALTIPV